MKIYEFWCDKRTEFQIGSNVRSARIVAGSNLSIDDAQKAWDEKKVKIQNIIDGQESRKKIDYDSEIQEHVYNALDEKNIITVNRYGALVWNSSEYSIYDMDDYCFDLGDLLFRYWGLTKKAKIVAKFKYKIGKMPELGTGFRIYETCKGVRIIGKSYFNPTHKYFKRRCRSLFVDWLYLILCTKQKCFRARLTPKPFRMKIESIKIKSPNDCLSEKYKEWAYRYFEESKQYSVVKLIESIGENFSDDMVIQYHDKMSNSESGLKLA